MEVSSAAIHPPLAGSEMSDHGGLPTRNICFQDRLPTGFSFIVDDVDGDIEPETEDEPEESAAVAPASAAVTPESAAAAGAGAMASVGGGGATGVGGSGGGSSTGGSARVSRVPSREGSPGAKEETDARVRQMQTEAESRKNEFARLLEEHAQVIQQLKQMEHDPAPGAAPAPAPAPAGSGDA